MFSSGPSYSKLKTNLRLAINRLKLLEKKKTELAQKARKEIADYIAAGKYERAKIRVEHIIREDYLVEAMEVTEMYCDLILARFGLIQQMKDLDPGLSEAISSLIWCAPRLMTDIPELKVVADQFAVKYGKPYAVACREQSVSTISEKLIHKLGVQAPPKILVEQYLQEIANNYNLEYTPDPQVMREAEWGAIDPLINLDDQNRGGGAGGGGGGGMMNMPMPGGAMGYPPPQGIPQQPFSYPPGSKAAEAMASGELNLPNVPGAVDGPPTQNQQPFMYPGAPPVAPFTYPTGPPPAPAVEPTTDEGAPHIGMHQPYAGGGAATGAGGGAGHQYTDWDDMLRLDNSSSPPPPYASIDDHNMSKGGGGGVPSAPPPSLPSLSPQQQHNNKPHFPPDVNASSTPHPAPRSKFGDVGATDTAAAAAAADIGFSLPDLPDLPNVPGAANTNTDDKPSEAATTTDDIDFDDLNKRFQQLKKK